MNTGMFKFSAFNLKSCFNLSTICENGNFFSKPGFDLLILVCQPVSSQILNFSDSNFLCASILSSPEITGAYGNTAFTSSGNSSA